jgi:Histidine kinase
MPDRQAGRPRRHLVLRVALAGVLLGFYVLPPILLRLNGQPVPLPISLATSNAVITFGAIGAVHRITPRGWSTARRVLAGGVLGMVVGGVFSLWFTAYTSDVGAPANPAAGSYGLGSSSPSAFSVFLLSCATSMLAIGTWGLAFGLPAAWEQQHVRELEVENLRLEAVELRTGAELQRLRGQLEPHFRLNTLNLIAGLVDIDRKKAREVLACLGDLLRDALEARGELHSLGEEVVWLQRYCQILEARYGSLQIDWVIDEDVVDALVPRLLLQPLIENALLHGALRRRPPGRVAVKIQRFAPREIQCTIEDDGPGLSSPRTGAIGIENVRRRLTLACPGSSFVLDACAGHTTAVVRIREAR